ncbi:MULTISPECIES: hypothetical protein [Flagellimonas]|uniref:Lipocalin-like domain-containing protein n=1 Tax=Flagellimonas hadalis TaxID=2597517 RepID=A0A5N5IQ20_9FLAO|nr:hypothetical protein [Allomuricauda hadalis]KAB5486992.1 hypothetical protein FOT42_012595 [Allomuricauda hadalis]RUA11830.1 MAG: hypothetical protein DSY83_16050 [Flavobacteriia bacterium]
MRRILPFILLLMLLGCKKTAVAEADLQYLNGYWEIAEVEFPDGSKKQYSVNPSIDFIKLKDGEGFRKKMQPRFDGSYDTSNDTEFFTVSENQETYTLRYKNEFSEWEEKLVSVDSLSFSVTNEEGVTYSYRRFQPIKIPK